MNRKLATDLQRVCMFTDSDRQQLQFLRQGPLCDVIAGMRVPGLWDTNVATLHMLMYFELSKADRGPALLNADVEWLTF